MGTSEVDVKGDLFGTIRLVVSDTGGMERFATLPRYFYGNTTGVLLVYDCTVPDSLKNIQWWHREALRNVQTSNPILVVVGNKCDDTTSSTRVSKAEGQKMAEELGCKFYEVSAETGEHLEDAIKEIVTEMYEASDDARRSRSRSRTNRRKDAQKNRSSSSTNSCVLL